MAERPIIFSAAMVRAILAGVKTQTRRVVKLKPWHQIEERDDGTPWPWMYDDDRADDRWLPCPYGVDGDRLWVRETCRAFASNGGPYSVLYTADAADRPINDDQHADWVALHGYGGGLGRQVPSIHMPRWASRITLDVNSVRVERLQDISAADAVAEGIDVFPVFENGIAVPGRSHTQWIGPAEEKHDSAAGAYRALWESINGPNSWDANPWVWVIEFRHVTEA